MLTVIARSQAKIGRDLDLEKALRRVVLPTHRELGCLRYAIHRGVDNPLQFVVVERWDSKASLDAHLKSDHVQKLFRDVKDLVEGQPEIIRYELLKEGDDHKGSL